MKNNKKGFTLVELLSVIVLIGLLIGIGVPGVMKISEKMKNRSYETKKDLIEQAGTLWGQDNKTLLQESSNCKVDEDGHEVYYNCKKVSIETLIEDDYLEADGKDGSNYIYKDPRNSSNIVDNVVLVYKKNNRVYSYYADATGTYDYIVKKDSLTYKIMNDSRITKNTTSPTFTRVETGEKGMYSIEDDYGESWYFRGKQSYNYVKFADLTWRIVRINGDGSVRLILDGTTSRTYYNGTLRTNLGSKVSFNTSYNANKYVGYMYNASSANANATITKSSTSSTAKIALDNFYQSYLKDYESYFADSLFCGDRTLYSGTGIGTSATYYGSYGRRVNKSPSLICQQKNDRYTVNDVMGNGALTYPIGLITFDELMFAGAYYKSENKGYYLYNDLIETERYFVTMSPAYYNSSSNHSAVYYSEPGWAISEGNLIHGARALRPVINLKPDVLIDGGTGTSSNPYTLKLI